MAEALTEEELTHARKRFSHSHFDGLWATLDARGARIAELERAEARDLLKLKSTHERIRELEAEVEEQRATANDAIDSLGEMQAEVERLKLIEKEYGPDYVDKLQQDRDELTVKVSALRSRLAKAEEALEATQAYWEMCVHAWHQDEGRLYTESGRAICPSTTSVEELADKAEPLVRAALAALRGEGTDA